VVQLLSGTSTLDQALAAAKADKDEADGRLCELYFFLGQQQLLEGRADAARDWFQKAVNTGVVEFTEYALAQRELQKLAAAR
jgi:lipoprotein NlpI